MEVPMQFSSFDAYCRQTNAIDEAIASRIDEYQSTHSNWKDEGGAGGIRIPTWGSAESRTD